jgi:L,D-transpeptidase catalytic domain
MSIRWLAPVGAAVAVAAGVVLLGRLGDGSEPAVVAPLPAPPASALDIRTPRPLADPPGLARWAPLVHAADARAAPARDAPVVAKLATTTPEGTANLVLVLGKAVERERDLWVRVRLPVLPNNTTGWVLRNALGAYETVRTHLVVDLGTFRATLYSAGRAIFRAEVGVGTPDAPTPRGSFYVRNKLSGFGDDFYGPIAFGTSARSDTLTDWPAGGFIGIHGTSRPDLLPGPISHGCIRMRNDDIMHLARLMPVGTPLTIRP